MSKKTLFSLTIALSFVLGFSSFVRAQDGIAVLKDPLIREVEGVERFPPEATCGNGVVEFGEQCDHGLDNGSEASICRKDCKYDIPEGQEECVEAAYIDCMDIEIQREDLLRELVEVRVAVEEGSLEEQAPQVENLADRLRDRELCVEEAIEECTPDEPEFPETPEEPTEEETPKDQVAPNAVQFEGSGCSLNSAATGGNGLAWMVLMGTAAAWQFPRRKNR